MPLDLKEKLKIISPELASCLEDIRKFSTEIWKKPRLHWFTNHNCDHSDEIIYLLGQILKPLENHADFLSDNELFVLLASAYLHDIGMQSLKVDSIPVDKLSEREYEKIRSRHAEESFRIILKTLDKALERDEFYLPRTIDEDFIRPIAYVSKGHSSECFDEVVQYLKENPFTPKNRRMRGELLTSLLLLADELDLQCKRVQFSEVSMITLSAFSQVQWFKHHYVDFVEVDKGTINITFCFPPDCREYSDLIINLITEKLCNQIVKVNPIFKDLTSGILNINRDIDCKTTIDKTALKRKFPNEILDELKDSLKKSKPGPPASMKRYMSDLMIPKVSKLFTGRSNELKKFGEALSIANIISIEGLGGIGKTEFALKCIEQFLSVDRVVWYECHSGSTIDSLIDVAGYPDALKSSTSFLTGDSKTEVAKYIGFIDLIEKDKRVIFIDNFQNVLNKSFTEFMNFAEKYLKQAKIIIISREHPNMIPKLYSLSLNGLTEADSFRYARRLLDTFYKDVNVDDYGLKKICDNLERHPFAIELAIQLCAYGESPDNIIQKIVQAKDKSRELSSKLLDEIFIHPKSTDDEREFMLSFSVFRDEVGIDAISNIISAHNVKNTLYKLIDKKMIRPCGMSYRTHPLIREFCYQKLENKKEVHFNASVYYKKLRIDKFAVKLEEEIFFHLLYAERYEEMADFVYEVGTQFVLSGHMTSLREMLYKTISNGMERRKFYVYYGDMATIIGEWDDAAKYYEKAFSFSDIDERVMAEAYVKYGELHFRKGEIKESLSYFEDAYKICKKNNYKKEEARSLNDIGLVCDEFGDMDSSYSKLDEALQIRNSIGDKEGIADTLINLGNHFKNVGEYEKALEEYHSALVIKKEIGDKSGTQIALGGSAGIYLAMGHLDIGYLKEALKYFQESLSIAEEIGDKTGIGYNHLGIAEVYRDLGRIDKALSYCQIGLSILEQIGNKHGIAASLDLYGTILRRKGELKNGLDKHKKALQIAKDIGGKRIIALILNNMANILVDMHNKDALDTYEESIAILEATGDKRGLMAIYCNSGIAFFKNNLYSLSLHNLFMGLSFAAQLGSPVYKNIFLTEINKLKDTLGFKKFTELAKNTFSILSGDVACHIDLNEFVEDKTVHRETSKVGRNDPCPCGSGSKYKKCCGK